MTSRFDAEHDKTSAAAQHSRCEVVARCEERVHLDGNSHKLKEMAKADRYTGTPPALQRINSRVGAGSNSITPRRSHFREFRKYPHWCRNSVV